MILLLSLTSFFSEGLYTSNSIYIYNFILFTSYLLPFILSSYNFSSLIYLNPPFYPSLEKPQQPHFRYFRHFYLQFTHKYKFNGIID